MDDVWKVVAAGALVFTVWSMGRAAIRSFEPHDLVPGSQLYSLGLSLTIYVAFAVLFGLRFRGAVPFALSAGAVGGYLTSTLSGYQQDQGYAVARGSAWYLAPVALSATLATYGALNRDGASLAVGFLGIAASLGVGTGQLAFSWQASRQARRAFGLTAAAPTSPVGRSAATSSAARTATHGPTTPFGSVPFAVRRSRTQP